MKVRKTIHFTSFFKPINRAMKIHVRNRSKKIRKTICP
jgi:hypothetical protein